MSCSFWGCGVHQLLTLALVCNISKFRVTKCSSWLISVKCTHTSSGWLAVVLCFRTWVFSSWTCSWILEDPVLLPFIFHVSSGAYFVFNYLLDVIIFLIFLLARVLERKHCFFIRKIFPFFPSPVFIDFNISFLILGSIWLDRLKHWHEMCVMLWCISLFQPEFNFATPMWVS